MALKTKSSQRFLTTDFDSLTPPSSALLTSKSSACESIFTFDDRNSPYRDLAFNDKECFYDKNSPSNFENQDKIRSTIHVEYQHEVVISLQDILNIIKNDAKHSVKLNGDDKKLKQVVSAFESKPIMNTGEDKPTKNLRNNAPASQKIGLRYRMQGMVRRFTEGIGEFAIPTSSVHYRKRPSQVTTSKSLFFQSSSSSLPPPLSP